MSSRGDCKAPEPETGEVTGEDLTAVPRRGSARAARYETQSLSRHSKDAPGDERVSRRA